MNHALTFHDNLHTLVWGTESWTLSAVPGSPSVIANGPLAGTPLSEVYPDFPLLVKIIDAKRDLSIQVHPDDALARERHNCLGKTEMWVILDAEPGAKLYSGFCTKITPEEYERRIADDSICEVLAAHEVRPGDVFFIPAGRPHAIGGGIRLAEIQQTSDITYRIYDYNRPGLDGKPRQLHTQEAKDALDYTVYPDYLTRAEGETLVRCPFFTVKRVTQSGDRQLPAGLDFAIYMCVRGRATISGTQIEEGQSVLLPHPTLAQVSVEGELIEAYIEKQI